ncbi:hypothetical protein IMZ48_36280 [Candidatus Bathyarchaeota archaeon]|nr:hypothetical protein [Candidatus Bathyarchaeota archaeon]
MSSSELAELERQFKKFFERVQEPMLNVFYEIYRMEPNIRGQKREVAPGLSRDASRDDFASHVARAASTRPTCPLCRGEGVVEDLGLDPEKLHTYLRRFADRHGALGISYFHIYEAMHMSFKICLRYEKDNKLLASILFVLNTNYHTLQKEFMALDKKLTRLDEEVPKLQEALKTQLGANDRSQNAINLIRSTEDIIRSYNNDLGFWKTEGSIDPSKLGIMGRVAFFIGDMAILCAKQIEENKATRDRGQPT